MQSLRESLGNMNKGINDAKSSLSSINNKSQSPFESIKQSFSKNFSAADKPSFFQSMKSDKPSLMERASRTIRDTPKKVTSIMSSVGPDMPDVMKSAAETTESFFNLKSILFWLLLIVLLAFVGFNIFTYLGEGTDIIANLLAPITSTLGMLSGDTAKTAVKNVSDGSQKIVDVSSKAAQGTMDYAAKGTDAGISFLQTGLNKPSIVNPENEDLETSTKLNNKKSTKKSAKDPEEPEPARSTSLSQGYCYIGKINDTRHCAKVSARSQCMSGDIYPSMDVCVNPNLRA